MDWSNLGQVEDWNDLDKMVNNDGATAEQKKESLSPPSQFEKRGGGRNPAKKDNQPSRGDKPQNNALNDDVYDWTDMKQYDDDHDPDWFEAEENRLADQYGGHFIKVKYTEQGRPGYFCELCLSEMNAKKSLEAHCEGMKHLKKKALWEKNNAADKTSYEDAGNGGGWSDNMSASKNRRTLGRDRSPIRNSRDRRSPPGSMFRDTANREQRDRGRRDDRRDDHRGGDDRRDDHRGGDDRRDDHRGGDDRRDDHRGGDDRRDDHRGGDNRDRKRRDERDSGAPRDDSAAHGSGARGNDQVGGGRTALKGTEKIGGSMTGMLLTKLASCCIKDEEDAELALNVVSSLTSSLKAYSTSKGHQKCADLLADAEIKLNTLKAVRVSVKIQQQSNKTVGSNVQSRLEQVSTVVDYSHSHLTVGNNKFQHPGQYGGNGHPQMPQQHGANDQYPAPGSNRYVAPKMQYEAKPQLLPRFAGNDRRQPPPANNPNESANKFSRW